MRYPKNNQGVCFYSYLSRFFFSLINPSFSLCSSLNCCSNNSILLFSTISPVYLFGSTIPACCQCPRPFYSRRETVLSLLIFSLDIPLTFSWCISWIYTFFSNAYIFISITLPFFTALFFNVPSYWNPAFSRTLQDAALYPCPNILLQCNIPTQQSTCVYFLFEIPNQRTKDQKTSIVGKSKLLDFPTNADCYGIPLISILWEYNWVDFINTWSYNIGW